MAKQQAAGAGKDPDTEKDSRAELDSTRALYEEGGLGALLDALEVAPRAAFEELKKILDNAPPLPPPERVFELFDKARNRRAKADGEKNDRIAPVLALMGLKVEDMAPGDNPWALRQTADRHDLLVISLGDGRKVSWERPEK